MANSPQEYTCFLALIPFPIFKNSQKYFPYRFAGSSNLFLFSVTLIITLLIIESFYCIVLEKLYCKFTSRVNMLSHFQKLLTIFPLYVCWFFQFILVLRDPDYYRVNVRVILLYSFEENEWQIHPKCKRAF